MNYKALETSKTQWSSHLKDRMTQEQVIQEGLELSEQFTKTTSQGLSKAQLSGVSRSPK